MRLPRLERLSGLMIVATLVAVWAAQVHLVVLLGDRLSPIADAFSEADAIRSAQAYAEQGFTSSAGLPRIYYGGQFVQEGSLGALGRVERAFPERVTTREELDSRVYSHYPPGPNWLCGLAHMLFGGGNIAMFRVIPLGLGLVCLLVFGWVLTTELGAPCALMVIGGCSVVPMFANMMHGLHYQGYSFSLLLVELAFVTRLISRPEVRLGRWVWALGLIGFLQGWLSFDYCFIVTFAPWPIAAVFARGVRDPRVIRAVWLTVALGAGFTVAHGLHFLQVGAYYDGMAAAWHDLSASARMRGSDAPSVDAANIPVRRLGMVAYYLGQLDQPRWLGVYSYALVALFFLHLIALRARIEVDRPYGVAVTCDLTAWRWLLAVGVAITVASFWVYLMTNHAWVHQHFLPRHYFLVYYVGLLATIQRVHIRVPQQSPSDPGAPATAPAP